MAQYLYKVRDENGSSYENIIIADSESMARSLLSEKGLWVINLEIVKTKSITILDFELDGLLSFLNKVGLRDLVIFCRQFSALVNSGVAMIRSLSILADQAENPVLAKILKEIRSDVEQGICLSDAFSKHNDVFDSLFISMIRAGETGGVLDDVLNRLAKFMEERARLTNKIKSAMAYPTVVSILATIIFFIMLTVILPKFGEIFSRLGSSLPTYTQFLINLSNVLRSPWIILIIFALGCTVYGFKKLYSIDSGRYFMDSFALKLPVFGVLLQKVAVAKIYKNIWYFNKKWRSNINCS